MNKKLIFIILCLVLSVIISISAISAGQTPENITSTAADDQSDILQNEDNNVLKNGEIKTFRDLDSKINDPNVHDGDTVDLGANYTFNETLDGAFINGISFTKSITIDGHGFTINANNQARIFGVGSDAGGHTAVFNVILKNINFENAKGSGTSDDYGCVEFWGNGKIINCNFTNSRAFSAAALAVGEANDFEIIACRFTNNTAYGQFGGAVRLKSSQNAVKIRNSWFENNRADDYGGAIYSAGENSNCLIDNCDFISNHAGLGGGAVYLKGYGGEVSASTFTSNNASSGGAIFTSNSTSVTITSSEFSHNFADYGGALYFFNTT